MANHGQNCCAGSRTYVHEKIYDEFVEKCKIQAENRILGDPWDGMTMQGPQVGKCSFWRNIKSRLRLEYWEIPGME